MTEKGSQLANIQAFRALVDADPALQQDVRHHIGDGFWDPAAVVELGRVRGLQFSAAELVAAMEDDEELSDFELEMVAAAVPQTCVGGGV